MKKSPLKRTKGIPPESDEGRKERILRIKLKQTLIERYGYKCMECGSTGGWIGLQLSHTQSLAQLGKTDEKNCQLLCAVCHGKRHGIKVIMYE